MTSLPGPKEVESVVMGPEGLAEGLKAGQIVIDLSTNSPTMVRELHAKLAEMGVAMLDAPVSGGPSGAQSGQLAIWVGGEQEAFDRALPVFSSISDSPSYVGPIGAGSVAKLVHNPPATCCKPPSPRPLRWVLKQAYQPKTFGGRCAKVTLDGAARLTP